MGSVSQRSHSRPQRQQKNVVYRSAGEIARGLGGSFVGGQGSCRCPAHDDQRPSLSITDGYIGQPIFHCMAGCRNTDIQDALVGLGLWPEFEPGERREASRPRPVPTGPSAEELRNLAIARQIYDQAFPCLQSTPCELYLRSRGVWLPAAYTTMRYARLTHPQTREENVPTLVIPRMDLKTGVVVACQRIYLNPDGSKYRKPYRNPDGSQRLADEKLSLGVSPDTWAILHSQERRTWETIERWIPPDPSRLPPGHDPFELSDALSHQFVHEEIERVETTDQLVLAEGPENALSASILYDRPCWAKCSGFPAEIWLPECVSDVLIAADNDPNGGSERKAKVLRSFIRGADRQCEIVVPETVGTDFNDVLLARTEAA